MSSPSQQFSVADLEVTASDFDMCRALDIFQKQGALVVRGLSRHYVEPLMRDIEEALERACNALPQAKRSETHADAWITPDGSSFNEDPDKPGRMLINGLRCNALTSAAFLESLLNPSLLEILEEILGPDIELWRWGQTIYRQPDCGVPKSLHQDEFYFEHKLHSTVAVLTYAVDVDLDNSPLHVVPGSHKLGVLEHVDDQWAGFALQDPAWWDRAVPITGRAGDSIIFNGLTVHGSPANRSDRARPVFIQRYRRADDFCVVDVSNVADREKSLKDPITQKTSEDWGLMVRGLRRN